ncbi:MAG: hypothetical protein IH935_11490 [Acidobacteria bacterium]|nr:hypothetical protein [Acidobacteriota bacterium]
MKAGPNAVLALKREGYGKKDWDIKDMIMFYLSDYRHLPSEKGPQRSEDQGEGNVSF